MISSTDATFDQDIVSDTPVVVKFGATWCGPCKMIEPILHELEEQYTGKVKFLAVDIDSTTIAQKFNIRGVPTMLFFKGGEVVNTIVGAQTKGRLQLAVDSVLE